MIATVFAFTFAPSHAALYKAAFVFKWIPMKYCFALLIIISACILLPQRSAAWGIEGHRITGQIAESYLTQKAKKAIRAILGDTSIAIASNWADFIKADSA